MRDINISVIIPSIGRCSINRAINSVIKQTNKPDEVIIVHDNDDNQRLDLKGVQEVWTKNARNVCVARNLGAKKAKYKYLAFLDDDDYWLPYHLEICIDMIKKKSAEMVCTSFWSVDGKSNFKPEKYSPKILKSEMFYYKNPGLRGSNLVIDRDTYFNIGGFNASLLSMNDLDFGIRASDNDVKYHPSDQRTVVFNQHNKPRLSTPGSKEKESGILNFWLLHNHRMDESQKSRYLKRAKEFWKVSDDIISQMIDNK